MRLLVVEDSSSDRRLILHTLYPEQRQWPTGCFAVPSLEQAEAVLKEHVIDVVLLDLNLEDSSGLETFDRLAAHCALTAVVILSGQSDQGLALQAIERGAQDYVEKDRLGIPSLLAKAVRYAYLRTEVARKLKAAERRLHTVLESTSDAIFIVNSANLIRYANKAALQLLGLANLNHKPVFPFPHTFGRDQEVKLANGSGPPLFLQMNVSPTEWDEEEAFCISLADVSAAKNAGLAKAEFLAKVSHDIRVPLNAVIGAAQLLQETPLNEAQANYVSLIENGSATLVSLVDDTLDLSKIEAGATQIRPAPFSLRKLLTNLCGLMEIPARAKGVEFHLDFAPSAPDWVEGDPTRINQLVSNLVSNAVKFTSKGSVRVHVTGEDQDQHRGLRLSVADTGIGISTNDHERIFSAYQQVVGTGSSQYGGTGLGLAICRKVAELMGGTVQVVSEPGQGSTFVVELPLPHLPTPNTILAVAPVKQSRALAVRTELPRLLIAEDCAANRAVINAFLAGTADEVDFAEDGVIAVQLFKERAYDLVLLDMQMPNLDGYGAAAEMRQWEKRGASAGRPTTIVALTGATSSEDRQRCLDSGCDAYLSKPIRKEALLSFVETIAASRSASEQ